VTREAKYAGIILAAGRSTRMGSPKAELRLRSLGGKTAIESLAQIFLDTKLAPVIAVGADAPGVTRVEGEPDQPMIDSLARAIALLPPDIDGAVVQPIDAPYTTAELVRTLTSGPVPARARVLYCVGQPGHPVLVARALFEAIAARPPGGLRAILDRESAALDRVEVADERILADLDTPEDIREWES
jgi:molybdenum cofactor cytidylyltransferase